VWFLLIFLIIRFICSQFHVHDILLIIIKCILELICMQFYILGYLCFYNGLLILKTDISGMFYMCCV